MSGTDDSRPVVDQAHHPLHDRTVATGGMGYPDTRTHAPNENIRVDLYLKHAKHMARIIGEFAK
jgi:acetylornithine deacetylase/succinyl-diaminopimelate desuccinylase-like protein